MRDKHPAERRMPWSFDMARHPDSQFIEQHGTGRCQNPTSVICPYCADNQGEFYDREDGHIECQSCEREFRYEASFGYGYSTYPKECRPTEHRYVFKSQYRYEGRLWRVMGCIRCDARLFHVRPADVLMLPWLDEYDAPDYFDPEGALVSTVEPRPTPVLDCLCDGWGTWRNTWDSRQMARALRKHDECYGVTA